MGDKELDYAGLAPTIRSHAGPPRVGLWLALNGRDLGRWIGALFLALLAVWLFEALRR